ncbi:DUF6492 family protein [Nioella sp.]|uniref:DUF6492 family protein n=1 Tax=Nioella sp. TaxID=1912091 RepID=UPI003B5184F9
MSDGLLSIHANEDTKISVVIVYYEFDVSMAGLLARSLEKYLDPELACEIIFLDNCANGELGRAAFENEIRTQFDTLKTITRRVRLESVSDRDDLNGYTAQQSLKLEVARLVKSPFYLVLDTKNHLICNVSFSTLFSDSGLPRSSWANHTGYLRTCLNHSAEFFGVTIEENAKTLPTVTPYIMNTQIVCALLDHIKSKGWESVYDVIIDNDKRTEFLLYYSFIHANYDLETVYCMGPSLGTTLFANWPQDEELIEKLLDSVGTGPAFALGIHSRRFKQLSYSHAIKLAQIWQRVGLFPSLAVGLDLISAMAKQDEQVNLESDAVAPPIEPAKGKVVSDIVFEGRNGRLFINEGSNSPLKQHTGELLLSDQQVRDWRRLLEVRKAYCDMYRTRYAMIVAPDTHAIHREDIPALDGSAAIRPVQQIQTELADKVPLYYPLSDLRIASADGHVCHTTDSHWSGYGAYVAYHSFMQAYSLSEFTLEPSDVDKFDLEGKGDLGDKCDPVRLGHYTECVARKPAAEKTWDNGVSNRGYIGQWKNSKTELPRAVIFMDSYGWKILRFFVESFSETMAVHTPYFEWDVIEEFKPDVVISLMAERFLIKPPLDFGNESALESARKKGGEEALPEWLRTRT